MSGDLSHIAAAPLRTLPGLLARPAARAGAAGTDGGTPLPGGSQNAAQKIRERAEEFEAVFLNTLLAPVFTRAGEGADGSANAGGPWRSLLVEEYSKVISKAGGIGIADAIERQLLIIQEAASAAGQLKAASAAGQLKAASAAGQR